MLYSDMQIKGLSTELECEKRFIELGFIVSIPYGNNARYDFIVDDGNKRYRMQAKTLKQSKTKNFYILRTANTRSNTKEIIKKPYTKEDIDYFCSITENNELLVIPVEDCKTKEEFSIHVDNTTFSGGKHLVSDYLFNGVFSEYKPWIPTTSSKKEERKKNITPRVLKTEEQKIQESTCPLCGNPKSAKATICRECFEKQRTNLNREEYKEKIRTMKISDLAKELNINVRVLRRKLQVRGLPTNKKEINSYTDEEWAKL